MRKRTRCSQCVYLKTMSLACFWRMCSSILLMRGPCSTCVNVYLKALVISGLHSMLSNRLFSNFTPSLKTSKKTRASQILMSSRKHWLSLPAIWWRFSMLIKGQNCRKRWVLFLDKTSKFWMLFNASSTIWVKSAAYHSICFSRKSTKITDAWASKRWITTRSYRALIRYPNTAS